MADENDKNVNDANETDKPADAEQSLEETLAADAADDGAPSDDDGVEVVDAEVVEDGTIDLDAASASDPDATAAGADEPVDETPSHDEALAEPQEPEATGDNILSPGLVLGAIAVIAGGIIVYSVMQDGKDKDHGQVELSPQINTVADNAPSVADAVEDATDGDGALELDLPTEPARGLPDASGFGKIANGVNAAAIIAEKKEQLRC